MRKLLNYFKEVIMMMAMLFATKVILGQLSFTEVPRLLKEQVKTILIENGLEELATEAA